MTKKKCFVCKKKLNIVFQFHCDCNKDKVFCSVHRNNHNCNINYFQNFKKQNIKNNPVIQFNKIQKI